MLTLCSDSRSDSSAVKTNVELETDILHAEPVGSTHSARRAYLKEAGALGRLGAPVAASLFLEVLLSLVTYTFVGPFGRQPLSVIGLAYQLSSALGVSSVTFGSSDALATLAAQTYGAGNHAQLPVVFWRGVLFNLAHTPLLISFLLAAPTILRTLGRDPSFTSALQKAGFYQAPQILVLAILYPVVNQLVAQGVGLPIMLVEALTVGCHVLYNTMFIHWLGVGFLGASVAVSLTQTTELLLLLGAAWWLGLGPRVWGRGPSAASLRGWGRYARLAYASVAMRAVEYYAYLAATLLAGFMPNPDVSQGAAAVTVDFLSLMYVLFSGLALAVTSRVGNQLGAGTPIAARRVLRVALILHPIIWLLVAPAVNLPGPHRWLVGRFAAPDDTALKALLSVLLRVVTLHVFFDGLQSIFAGALTGAGLQAYGMCINAIAILGLGVPLMAVVGFLSGLHTVGLFLGIMGAPVA